VPAHVSVCACVSLCMPVRHVSAIVCAALGRTSTRKISFSVTSHVTASAPMKQSRKTRNRPSPSLAEISRVCIPYAPSWLVRSWGAHVAGTYRDGRAKLEDEGAPADLKIAKVGGAVAQHQRRQRRIVVLQPRAHM
jgi:hypothetical protein